MSQKKKRKKRQVPHGGRRTKRKTIPWGKSRFNIDNKLLTAINYHRAGQLQKAQEIYERILEAHPNHSESLYLLGAVNHQVGKTDTAVDLYNKALQNDPDNPNYHNSLGDAFLGQGKLDEAVSYYQKALRLKPDLAAAHNNMGNAFKDQGKLNEAISCYEKALQLRPDWAGTRYNMGSVFENLGKSDEAIASYQKAVEIQPDYAEAYNSLGNAFKDQGKLDEAISCYQKALQLKSDYAEAYSNMGSAFEDQGKPDEAIFCFQKAIKLKPSLAEAYTHLVYQLQQTCDWTELKSLGAKLDDLTKSALLDGTSIAEAPLISIARHADPSRNLAVAKSWSRDIARTMSNLGVRFSFDDRSSRESRITVGYLSNDFCDHPVAHLMLSLFGLHNRDEFKILCYSYGEDDGSYCRKRIQQDCDKFIDVRHLSHAEAAKRIYEDPIDILVDLTGYTDGGRLEISALRPAPVQVSYLGFPGTTGASFLDYILVDRIVTPEDQAIYYSEHFVYMPHCYMVCDNTQEISNRHWKKVDFGLPEDGFVFCSFNSTYKIEPVIFDLWMQILHQVPKSVLWLREVGQTAESNLRREAEKRGISSERLTFSDRLPSKAEHLARLSLADLALDTRIYNGHATTSDALWAGVPVIALRGSHFASRASASLLTAIGLPEMIIDSLEEYKELAVRLAHNPDELEAIRQRLSENRLKGPLFDTPQFVRDLERAYKEMWNIFLAGEAPRPINVGSTNKKPHFGEKRPLAYVDMGSSNSREAETAGLEEMDEGVRKEKPSIRIFHNLARAGGTLVCRCLGCMQDTILLSEIHPLGTPIFDPLEQACSWHNLLTPRDTYSPDTELQIDFASAIQLIEARCHEAGQKLVIRDWGHLDFIGVPFLERPSYRMLLIEVLAPIFNLIRFALVRHPVDQWLSWSRFAPGHKLSVDSFLEGYLKFAQQIAYAGFIRYEEFTRKPVDQMKIICKNLQIDFDESFVQKWPDYNRVTGDIDGHSRGSRLRKIMPLPRPPVEVELLQRFRESDDYWKALKILDYADVESGTPGSTP